MAMLIHTIRNRVRELGRYVVRKELRLDRWQRRNARYLAPDSYDWVDSDWLETNVNDIWARAGQTAFLKRTAEVPVDWAMLKVGLEMTTGGEGLLSVNGAPYHGIDDYRGYVLLVADATGGEAFELEIEIKTGGYFEHVVHDPSKPYLLSQARLVGIDAAVESAWLDFQVAYGAAEAVGDPLIREAILTAMGDSLALVDFTGRGMPGHDDRRPYEELAAQLRPATSELRRRLGAIGYGRSAGTIHFAGHSHIDLAWLWPLRETRRKVGRTYGTVTALMAEFPEYHFVCSQAPLLIYLRDHFPTVFDKVRSFAREGRFELIGGTWVEHDTNVPSGESLVRQCLYGKRFFREEFGADVKVGWLPDVFGYTWSMPQIYKQAGLDFFMTSKVAWNETNRLPHNTFWWEGIDGSRVLAHLVHNLRNMYNAQVRPSEMLEQWANHADKLAQPEILCPFGYGDGGGGPTREMLEHLSRLGDIPGLPAARTGRTDAFFSRLAERSADLPVWNGEMYFERHRGTYTTQAKNKRWNRKSELLYRDAEALATAAALMGHAYPKDMLTQGWQTILLNQFHDILPGSSIAEVYETSSSDYAEVLRRGEVARDGAFGAIALQLDTRSAVHPIVVANTLSWTRTGVVDLGPDAAVPAGVTSAEVVDHTGATRPCQIVDGRLSFVATDVPSFGVAVYDLRPSHTTPASAFQVDGLAVRTPFYEMAFDDAGALTHLRDIRRGRDVLDVGSRANVLQVFEDKPVSDDAWDVDLTYQDRVWELQPAAAPRITADGPVRLVVETRLGLGDSTIVQRISLYAHDPRIDFETEVDWSERHSMLKVAFPVAIRSPRATYEIAYGAIERPTHWNTSWDLARFEVAGHRWADLSESGYGVAVLNDCKYGWDIKGSTIRLTLLRAPTHPDPNADLGVHNFVYSLLPHAGDWTNGVVRSGCELNVPLLARAESTHPGQLSGGTSFVAVDQESIIIDCIKQAEDSSDTVIRVYEAHGWRGTARMTFAVEPRRVTECNILEEDGEAVAVERGSVALTFRPWQVKTFKVRF